MAEEFEESDVIFPENEDNYGDRHNSRSHESNSNSRESRSNKSRRSKKKNKKSKSSAPVNIPENASGNSWFQYVDSELFDEDDYDGGGEIVPPHVIVGRRIVGKVAFSVCTGNGRTLKGRDLSEVRNSILRMTGFLET